MKPDYYQDERVDLLSRPIAYDENADEEERLKACVWNRTVERMCDKMPNEENLDIIQEMIWEEYREEIYDMGLSDY